MIVAILLICLSACLDIAVTAKWLWRWHAALTVATMLATTVGTLWLLVAKPAVGTAVVSAISVYRLFHARRVLFGRTNPQYLRQVARQTSVWLGGLQVAMLALAGLSWHAQVPLSVYALTLALAQVIVGVGLYLSLRRQLRTTASETTERLELQDLPSVTVAVPARNEDGQLEASLASILASDYPKLEVIVLDDCSTDQTSDIVRRYAHDGVRFIKGDEPHEGWLAKNQAYARLAAEASGEYIVFCGVDVRFGRQGLRQLVETALHRKKDMVCVLPQNAEPAQLPLLQSMRYFWEMVPPRRLFRRPPVLSSCWLVRKTALAQAGGFAAASRSITPEAHVARSVAVYDGYSFVRGDAALEITSEKPKAAQTDTAIVTRYPQLHRRIELVMLLAAAELLFVLGAPLLFLASLAAGYGIVTLALSLLATVLLAFTYGQLQRRIFTRVSPLEDYIAMPAAFLADLYMLHVSMYKYEFSEVIWKDRNVCYPVMRHVAATPESAVGEDTSSGRLLGGFPNQYPKPKNRKKYGRHLGHGHYDKDRHGHQPLPESAYRGKPVHEFSKKHHSRHGRHHGHGFYRNKDPEASYVDDRQYGLIDFNGQHHGKHSRHGHHSRKRWRRYR